MLRRNLAWIFNQPKPGVASFFSTRQLFSIQREPSQTLNVMLWSSVCHIFQNILHYSLPFSLRALEYYAGILFLTTNRVGAIDEAFKSRIHMTLYYPPLNKDQTKKIWEMKLRRIKGRTSSLIDPEDDDILSYSKQLYKEQVNSFPTLVWNGRQIRNAFQTASAIAEFQAQEGITPTLKWQHFDTVAKASMEFDKYLLNTKKKTDPDEAFDLKLRDDSFISTDSSIENDARYTNQLSSPSPQAYPTE